MAVLEEPRARTAGWTARAALVVEWTWALCICDSDQARAKEREYPVRQARFAGAPGLEDRIRTFWEDGYGEFTELPLLAHRGEVLWEADAERVLARLAQVARRPLGEEPLDSERPEHRLAVRRRLDHLRTDARRRQAWLRLVSDVAAAVRPAWEAGGAQRAEEAARALRAKAARSGGWPDVKGTGLCADWDDDRFPALCQQAVERGGEVVVVPASVGGRALVLAFGDLVLFSTGLDAATVPSEATRQAAKRLRALADPTRLGIVELLGARPRSVGALAEELRLSQPTISNHVRLLREAGLVRDGERGSRALVVLPGAVRALTEEVVGRLPSASP